MSVLGCGFCGYQIRYHGEPEGTEPVEHCFCTAENWHQLEEENLPADQLELEHEEKFFYASRCKRCETLMFFNHLLKNIGTYVQIENFSTEPMQKPTEFGPFWNDFQWFDITESGIQASEVLKKFPSNRWFEKNDQELRFYEDQSKTKCVAQYEIFERPKKITVATMSLDSFKKMLVNYDDEIDFFYQKTGYEFIKEHLDNGQLKIIVNRDFDIQELRYSVTINEGENYIDDLIHAKIFPDGRSIFEAQSEIEL